MKTLSENKNQPVKMESKNNLINNKRNTNVDDSLGRNRIVKVPLDNEMNQK
jgi:hypothetical protein